jgi:hypothetical protein
LNRRSGINHKSKDLKFYLYPRGGEDGIYYVYFKHPATGKTLSGKSTKTRDYDEAYYLANKWFHEGFPDEEPVSLDHKFRMTEILHSLKEMENLTGDDAKKILRILEQKQLISDSFAVNESGDTFIEFLNKFWDFDNSPYVREKQAFKQNLGRRRCQEALGAIKNYWEVFFKERLLSDLRRAHLKDFQIFLGEKGLRSKTKNNILNFGTVALNWAVENELINSNVTSGLRKYSGEARKRGILFRKDRNRSA